MSLFGLSALRAAKLMRAFQNMELKRIFGPERERVKEEEKVA
jgi:hypothetical protein